LRPMLLTIMPNATQKAIMPKMLVLSLYLKFHFRFRCVEVKFVKSLRKKIGN
jgi:hypothetical protein